MIDHKGNQPSYAVIIDIILKLIVSFWLSNLVRLVPSTFLTFRLEISVSVLDFGFGVLVWEFRTRHSPGEYNFAKDMLLTSDLELVYSL